MGSRLSLFVSLFLLISTLITGIKFRFTLFAGLLSLVVIHSLISAINSNYSDIAISYWIDFIKVIVISYLITMLVKSEKDLRITLIVISLSLGLEGAKQGWAQLILNPGATNNNTHPLLGDNNGVAVGMLMIVPILFALYQTTEKKMIKYGFAFLAIGVIYRAISTYSRGGFLTFLTMCIIFWLRSKNKIKPIIIFVLLVAIIYPVLPQEFWDRMSTIDASEDERDASAAGRVYFWKVAYEMAQKNPVFGVGHNVYREAYVAFQHEDARFAQRRAVHSAWFGILAEWGYPGIILFISFFYYSLFSCAKVRKQCKNNTELKSLLIYCNSIETSLISCSVGITFLSFQYYEILWHFFALAAVINQALIHKNAVISDNLKNANEADIDFNREIAEVS